MKNAFWAYWLILLGIFIVVIMLLVQNLTTSSTQDYFLVKEITDAALIDAVDFTYYRNYGEIRINKEKFYESFIRRFAETANLSTEYTVSFYGVYEAPPKVSVEIKSKSQSFNVVGNATSVDMVERIDSILEGTPLSDVGNNGFVSVPKMSSSYTYTATNTNTNVNNSGVQNIIDDDILTPSVEPTIPEPIASQSTQETVVSNESVCDGNVANTDLRGIKGTPMTNSLNLYQNESLTGTVLDTLVGGNVFTIDGSNASDTRWLIKYGDKCGWISNDRVAIDLSGYFSSKGYLNSKVVLNITNNSRSIFNLRGESIYGVTGNKLYKFDGIVPATYKFAKELAKAVANTVGTDYVLEIFEVYRPTSVSRYVYNQLEPVYTNLLKTNYTKFNDLWGSTYLGDLIAPGGSSTHNYGCGVDISFVGYDDKMPTKMHSLTVDAKNSNSYSNDLYEIMTRGTDLKKLSTEWWHFEFKNKSTCPVKEAMNFWSAV